MKAKLLILSHFAIASLHAADPATENSKDSSADNQLRQGLFEEEANQNYEKAGTHYRAVVEAYQRQRTLAATATYRLGELARKANDNAAAASAFQAVIERFPEQKTAQLSSENLTALGIKEPALAASSADIPELEKAVKEQSEIVEQKRIERDNLLRSAPAIIRDNIIGINGANAIQNMQTKLESQVETATSALAELDKMIKQIDALHADEVIRYAANLDAAGADLKSLYPEYQSHEQILKGMQTQGLGPIHPTVVAQKRTVDSLYKQLQVSVVSFKESLKFQRASKLAEQQVLKNVRMSSRKLP